MNRQRKVSTLKLSTVQLRQSQKRNEMKKQSNTMVVNHVLETSNYDLFKSLKGNRIVNLSHVAKLKKSMTSKYLVSPIIVNEKMQVIDGQHRFASAKQLKLPIRYIVVEGYGLEEVQVLNQNTANWKNIDFLNAYCDLGYEEYLKMEKFMNMFPDFSLKSCEGLLTGKTGNESKSDKKFITESNKTGKYHVSSFRDGEFKVYNWSRAVELANMITMIKPLYDSFSRVSFISAMIPIFDIPEYDHNQFIERLKSNPNMLVHCRNITEYRLLIEEIYNFRSRNKVNLRF